MDFKEYWNEVHKKYANDKIVYDNWLDNYKDIINKCHTPVLDLGCGCGNDTLYLKEKGFDVIACDYSEYALKFILKNIDGVEVKLLDISKPLPFKDESFDLIIADLSLHYFSSDTTLKIMKEIKRILKKKGHLLARINSTSDVNYGALQGVKLEENFYFTQGYNKRFFSLDDAFKYFSIIGKTAAKESIMLRYEKPKNVIEVNVEKI